ncbi:DUF418 domain-containing protein [Alkalibacillus haloalkaliphilus]|uniref:DUF418 domain-containing protein n=1 Tax=Alkalibacillus haloalkaliphilus TaxID=94136 RepID=A0A511W8K6_9BACI|nr:DUF418 domain-containing protein [Alkalibacillus haloalkaliphilus]GEN45682.1 hypothetical protein AHA02nite_14580 [Alkalibacillus haloalkaliphilus]
MEGNQNRIQSIDAIRGFALLGILVVNVLAFHSPHFMYGGIDSFYQSATDSALLTFIGVLFQASFYPLFALLFGVGIYIMYERLTEKVNDQAKSVLRRRMFVLAAIGLAHGVFIWYGDILLTYSIVGLLTIWLIQKPVRSLLKWAAWMLGSVTAFMTLMNYAARDFLANYRDEEAIAQSFALYTGTYADIFDRNIADWLVMFNPLQVILMILTILPMFLVGIVLVKLGWVTNPKQHISNIRKWIWITLIIFIVFKVGPYLMGDPVWLDYIKQGIGGSFSSLFYFLILLVTFSYGRGMFIQSILAPVGKLSLTNYLLQSLIAFVFFYGVGFNFYGQLNIIDLMAYVVIVYSVQVVLSIWYLKVFQYGPFEWVYRTLTYGKVQRLKRRS